MNIDLTIKCNYLKVQWTPAKNTDEKENIAFYPITHSCFTVNMGMVIDPKGGTLWTSISVSLFNSMMNTRTEITNDDIVAGLVTLDSGKTIVANIQQLTDYLACNTGYPINNSADVLDPVLEVPIKTVG